MSGGALAEVIPAGDTFLDAALYKDPFEYISADAEDFKIALSSGQPHSFISAAVELPNAGPHHVCGMGHFNAIELHQAIIDTNRYAQPYLLSLNGVKELLAAYTPSEKDIKSLAEDITFNAAIDAIGADKLPKIYKEILGHYECQKRAHEARLDRHPR